MQTTGFATFLGFIWLVNLSGWEDPYLDIAVCQCHNLIALLTYLGYTSIQWIQSAKIDVLYSAYNSGQVLFL